MSDASHLRNRTGPDFFSFYARKVADLLSQDENFLPSFQDAKAGNVSISILETDKAVSSSANPLFGNSFESTLPDLKRELLKSLLRQSLSTFLQEVDEMINPVLRIRQMFSFLRCTKQNSRLEAVDSRSVGEGLCRKLKISASSSETTMAAQQGLVNNGSGKEESGTEVMHSKSLNTAISDKRTSDTTKCAHCATAEAPQWQSDVNGRKTCDACCLRLAKGKDLSLGESRKRKIPLNSNEAVEEAEDVDENYRSLLETENSLLLEEILKKHSDDLSQTLHHMEQQLEEFIDTVVSKCRPMSQAEKQQLRKQIQNLHPKNLERVVEIISHKKPTEAPSDEIFVDLENQANITLWRLYFYVKAVENATKLST